MLPLRRYEQYWLKIGDFAPIGSVRRKISGWRGRPTNHSSSHGIQIWTALSFVLSQCMRLTDGRTDRQTYRQTDSFLVARPPCIQCSAVKRVFSCQSSASVQAYENVCNCMKMLTKFIACCSHNLFVKCLVFITFLTFFFSSIGIPT